MGLVSGCATRGGPVPYNATDFTLPDSQRPDISDAGIIGKLDTLTIQVYQLPDLNREIQVDREGNIAMPLIGTLHADGLTTPQLSQLITDKLADRYVRSPSVQVSLKSAIAKQIVVEGSVTRPGVFETRGQTTLLGALAMAAGPNDTANIHRVVVFRYIGGKRHAAAFDLGTIRKGLEPDPVIYGNDTIVVDGSKLTRAYRDLLQAIPLLYIFKGF
ncbi:MAG: polysaccharide biosynthesis/export family protein [Novosphingobium sp.]